MSHLLLALLLAMPVVIPLWPLSEGRKALVTTGPRNPEDPLIQAMKFVRLPKGTFWMGWYSESEKSKQVTIEHDFEIAAYPVTQEQWQEIMGANPSWFSRQGKGKAKVQDISDADIKRFPVEMVSWDDVQAFLKKLNEREKGRGYVYRLPTGAEWEYACRGGATSKEECSFDYYLLGPSNDLSSQQANFNGKRPGGKAAKGVFLSRPTPVGSYVPNKLGLYDTHGNVWQWCEGMYHANSSERVIRGGSWVSDGLDCRAGLGFKNLSTTRNFDRGFRLVRTAPKG